MTSGRGSSKGSSAVCGVYLISGEGNVYQGLSSSSGFRVLMCVCLSGGVWVIVCLVRRKNNRQLIPYTNTDSLYIDSERRINEFSEPVTLKA